jgi:hypothetical protein
MFLVQKTSPVGSSRRRYSEKGQFYESRLDWQKKIRRSISCRSKKTEGANSSYGQLVNWQN